MSTSQLQVMENDDDSASSRAAKASGDLTENENDWDQRTEAKAGPGRTLNFAEKIYYVLSNELCQDSVVWLLSGQAFCIPDKEKFVKVVLPKLFESRSNFDTFERCLRMWGFHEMRTNDLYIFSNESFRENSLAETELTGGSGYNIMKRLRFVLSSLECQRFISWLPSGHSFCISHRDEFIENVMPKFFCETHFHNFVTTLENNGFKRVQTADFIGDAVYSHELFQQGRPELCKLMCCEIVDGKVSDAPPPAFQVTMDSSQVPQNLRPQGISTGGMLRTVDPTINNRSNQLSDLVGFMSTIDSTSTLLQRQVMNLPARSHRSELDVGYPNSIFATNQQHPLMQYSQTQSAWHTNQGVAAPQSESVIRINTALVGNQPFPFAHQPVGPNVARQRLNTAFLGTQHSMVQLGEVFLQNHQDPLVQGRAQGIQQACGQSNSTHATFQSPSHSYQARDMQYSPNAARRVSCRTDNSEEVSQKLEYGLVTKNDAKITIHDIDNELLRVREMKLLLAQRKLKARHELEEEEEQE